MRHEASVEKSDEKETQKEITEGYIEQYCFVIMEKKTKAHKVTETYTKM